MPEVRVGEVIVEEDINMTPTNIDIATGPSMVRQIVQTWPCICKRDKTGKVVPDMSCHHRTVVLRQLSDGHLLLEPQVNSIIERRSYRPHLRWVVTDIRLVGGNAGINIYRGQRINRDGVVFGWERDVCNEFHIRAGDYIVVGDRGA